MSIATFVLTTTTVGALALGAGGVGAAVEADTPKAALEQLCRDRGGRPFFSPYAIARCQGARANKGFDAELRTCEDLAAGDLVVVLDAPHPNRANWACIATSPAT